MALSEVSIHPIRNVQGPVNAQGEEIVRRDSFRLPGPLKHEQLGQYGDALQPEREGPEDLGDGPAIREQNGEDGTSS